MSNETPVPESAVPADVEPGDRCPHCDRPFKSAVMCHLHVGEVHPESADERELEDYETALEEERDALFLYQLKVTVVLGLTYATSALVLLLVLG